MAVPVVRVRHVRMIVHERRVAVGMGMRLGRWHPGSVVVLVVRVVRVQVVVLERLVPMRVRVPFAQQRDDT